MTTCLGGRNPESTLAFPANATAGSMCSRLRNFGCGTGPAPAMGSYSRFTSIRASAATI